MQSNNMQRAQLLFQQGRYDMAADALHAVLAEMPSDPHAHALLALCLLERKEYEKATESAELAIHNAPDFAFAHYVLGYVYEGRNRFAEAEAAAREALRLGPENANHWALLAQTLFSQSRWRESLDAATQGLQADPDNTNCNNLRAMAMVQLGDKAGASQTIADALRRNPHSAPTHANQGWALLHQGQPKQAQEHFAEALRLDPTNAWARSGMIEALKARHLLYRMMLRYYLWMSRFSRRGQWGIIIGLWIAFEILQQVKSAHPEWAPFIYPLLIGYAIFVLASWLFQPVFDLTLMMNRFGRYLLSPVQRAGALTVGGLLLCGIALGVAGWQMDSALLLLLGIVSVALTLPTAATFRRPWGKEMLMMGLYTLAAGACGAAGVVLMAMNDERGPNLFLLGVLGCMAASFVANMLASRVQKR